ncbi:hypothetical protein LCGC14_0460760 [marine sediment metagenome]|uniref:Uncharacterized protein n=1 Tax=marine sediment metagenome TaxID=412755 RepID=A0A0F9SK70_9ZZZZ|nr:hypothetical protein [bacterium]
MSPFDSHHRMVSIKFRADDYLDLKAAAEKVDKPVSNFAREIVLDKIHDRPGTIKNYIKFLDARVASNFKRISEISPVREVEIKVLKGENSIFIGMKKLLKKIL